MPLGGRDAHRTAGGTPALQILIGFESGRAPDAAVSNRFDEEVFIKTIRRAADLLRPSGSAGPDDCGNMSSY
jgi:hypothetical protein